MIHERDLGQALAPIRREIADLRSEVKNLVMRSQARFQDLYAEDGVLERLHRVEALWDGLARQQEENAGRLVEAIDKGPVRIIGAFEDQINDLERRLAQLEAWRLMHTPMIAERMESANETNSSIDPGAVLTPAEHSPVTGDDSG